MVAIMIKYAVCHLCLYTRRANSKGSRKCKVMCSTPTDQASRLAHPTYARLLLGARIDFDGARDIDPKRLNAGFDRW